MIAIKPTEEKDLTAIYQMERRKGIKEFIQPYRMKEHREALRSDKVEHLSVFDQKNHLIGFVLLNGIQPKATKIELKRIVISDPGKGLGTQVLKMIHERCFKNHLCKEVGLDVFKHNQRALSLYLKMGFVITEATDELYILTCNAT